MSEREVRHFDGRGKPSDERRQKWRARHEGQEKSAQWFRDNLGELCARYGGKYLAIKECKVMGVYSTFDDAIKTTLSQGHMRGTFLIQHATTEVKVFF